MIKIKNKIEKWYLGLVLVLIIAVLAGGFFFSSSNKSNLITSSFLEITKDPIFSFKLAFIFFIVLCILIYLYKKL